MKQPGKYALTGALAGLANGLFGSGGGLFLVPLFTGWAKLPQRKAFATSGGGDSAPVPCVGGGVLVPGRAGCLRRLALSAGRGGGRPARWENLPRVPLVWVRRAFGLLLLYGGVRAVLAL